MKTNEFNSSFSHIVDLIFTIPTDQLEDWKKTLKRLKTLQKEGKITVKYTIKDKEGQDFSSEITGKPFVNKSEETLLFHVVKDDTLPKRYQKVEESRKRWKTLVTQAPDVIFTLDRDLAITYINQTPTSSTPEEVIGTNALDYVAKEHKEFVKKSIEKVFKTGEPLGYEIRADSSYDSKAWFSTRVNAIKEGNEVKEVLLITRDINERKEYEKKLEELQELKSNLMRRTSHELKTPLITIKGYTDWIFERHSDEMSDALKSKLKEIRSGCRRLENLIEDLLKAEKLEMGWEKMTHSNINLIDLIEDVIKEIQSFLKSRDLHLHKDITEESIYMRCELYRYINNKIIKK